MSDVLSEHHDYLTLNGRAALYAAAIAQVLRPGDVVADLGCGFGVLGLQCLRAGAARVYGVDSSDALPIARETMARAGLDQSYECIASSSFACTLPGPVDLVICDHVGWFGFDYHIIPMLEDARQRLLRPGGQVMPRRIALHAAGISGDGCAALVDRWGQPPVPPEFAWLREYEVNTKHPFEASADDLCTAPAVLGDIDLTHDSPPHLAFTASLTATRAAIFRGIAGWFACELAEGIWMSNSPLGPEPLGRNQVFLAAREPFAVQAGEEIGLTLRFSKQGDMIAWTFAPPGERPRQKLSTFNALPLGAAELRRGAGC